MGAGCLPAPLFLEENTLMPAIYHCLFISQSINQAKVALHPEGEPDIIGKAKTGLKIDHCDA